MREDILFTLLLVLAIVPQIKSAQQGEICEGDVLRKFPARDFREIHAGIKEASGAKFAYSENVRGLTMREQEISDITVIEEVAKDMTITPDVVAFSYPKGAFYFDITYVYDYSVAAFPVTGFLVLRFTAAPAAYGFALKNRTTLAPGFNGGFSMKLIYNSNPVAVMLGFIDMLSPTVVKVLLPHYLEIIKQQLLVRLANYYQSYYTHRVSYLKYPLLRNLAVRVESDLTGIAFDQSGMHLMYDSKAEALNERDPDGPYLRKVSYNYGTLGKIVSTAAASIQSFSARTKDIDPNSYFQLDMKALQHIFPEILLPSPPKKTVMISFNATKTDLTFSYNSEEGTITSDGLVLNATIYLEDEAHLPELIMDSSVKISGTYKPAIACEQNSTVAALHLLATRFSVKLIEAKSGFPIQVLFNPSAISSFVKNFLEQHLIKRFGVDALGEGLKVSTGYKIDGKKSMAILNKVGIEAILY